MTSNKITTIQSIMKYLFFIKIIQLSSLLVIVLMIPSYHSFTLSSSITRLPSSSSSTTSTTILRMEPLFDITNEHNNNNNNNNKDHFQVYDNDDNDDNEEEEYDYYDDDYKDEGQSYTLDYDDNDVIDIYDINNNNNNNNNNDTAITSSSSSSLSSSLYTRDEDDILTEREDRLYENMDLKEKCILVAVEDVTALRRNKHFHDKYNSDIDDNSNSNDDQGRNINPEEWEVYFTLEESMNEMKDLIYTCGMGLVGTVSQRLNDINPRTYIGTGKVKEVQALLEKLDANTVVFDAELTPRQQKHLENTFNKEVIQNDFLGSEQIVSSCCYDNNVLITFHIVI